jgi:hypothetical protein
VNPETTRELAILNPGQYHFQGLVVGPYSGAHRALLRSLIKPPAPAEGEESSETPKVPYDILSWMMLYVMATPRADLIRMAYDEELTYDVFTGRVLEWADTFPANANIESLKITTSILTDVNNITVTASTEKKTTT